MKSPTRRVSPVVVAAIALVACHPRVVEQRRAELVIAAGSPGGVFDLIARQLVSIFDRVPGVRARLATVPSASGNVERVQRGAVDVAFDGAGFAYSAFIRGTATNPEPHSKLRAIAVLFPTSVQIAARRDSRIHAVGDLRGKRLAVGPRGEPTDEIIRLILAVHGLSYDEVTPVFHGGQDVIDDLRERRVDAAALYAPSPHTIAAELARSAAVDFVPIARKRIGMIQAQSPVLLKTVVISAGTYEGQPADITTIGADILLIARVDLPEPLVHDLTRALFDSTRELVAAHPAAAAIDADRGPAASIPLHPGAARYYRERELLR